MSSPRLSRRGTSMKTPARVVFIRGARQYHCGTKPLRRAVAGLVYDSFSLFLSALGSRWLLQGVLRQVHEGTGLR